MGTALRRTLDVGLQEACHGPAMCTHSPESQKCPGLLPKGCGQVKGGDSALLFHTGETHLESCKEVWDLQYKKDMDLLEQEENRQDDWVAGAPLL